MPMLHAPITAVTVFPDRARITRSGTLELAAGEQRISCGPLPVSLIRDSVRVSGQGPATVLGVDVLTQRQAQPDNAEVSAAEQDLRAVHQQLGALDDADAVAMARERFLGRLALRAARRLASDDDVTAGARFADGLDAQLSDLMQARRVREQDRVELGKQRDALVRRLADLSGAQDPDQAVVQILCEVSSPGTVTWELSYLVPEAGWESTIDLRLAGERVTATWYGLISQRTGEDWPECALRLSTARPAQRLAVPELDPWYVDLWRPPVPMPAKARGGAFRTMAAPPMAPAGYAMEAPAPQVVEHAAGAEQGQTAATYTPGRPVAVPADGTAHRTLVAQFDLEAKLDYLTAPVRAPEAVMRATITNSSEHTLPPAPAALFHEGDYVGSTRLEPWAPDEERELALGVDDRVRVERELKRHAAGKVILGSTQRIDADYEITVGNYTPRSIRVTVLDQLPVPRDAKISVKETHAAPEPAERDELGVLTWRTDLATGTEQKIKLGFRVESPKGSKLAGWRE